MANPGKTMENANSEARKVGKDVMGQPWVQALTRLGYLVRGVLYATVGVIALRVALGAGGDVSDNDEALGVISRQTFGEALLVIVIIGLAGYALWGLIRAALDPLGKGTGLKAIAERGGYIVSALAYGSLLVPAVRLLTDQPVNEEANGDPTRDTAWLLSQPLGQWLVAALGIISAVGGAGQLYFAVTAKFKKDFKTGEMSEGELKLATWMGRAGHAARGVVFILIGLFLVKAALDANAQEARGLSETLVALAQQPYGPWLLGLVAAGLAAFGVYSMLCARWIKIWKPKSD